MFLISVYIKKHSYETSAYIALKRFMNSLCDSFKNSILLFFSLPDAYFLGKPVRWSQISWLKYVDLL